MTGRTFETSFFKGVPPAEGGYPGYNPRTEKAEEIICDYDVTVKMRDGNKIYVDIFRPEKKEKYPVIYRGYVTLAKPLVRLMRNSKELTEIVNFFVQHYLNEMLYRMGKKRMEI